jgi:hypothetical protein
LFAKWVEEKEGIQSPDGWYRITGHYVSKTYDPSILFNKYNSSLQQFLVTVYPEFPWKMYRFIQTPHDYWNEENVKEFIKDFKKNSMHLMIQLSYTHYPKEKSQILVELIC